MGTRASIARAYGVVVCAPPSDTAGSSTAEQPVEAEGRASSGRRTGRPGRRVPTSGPPRLWRHGHARGEPGGTGIPASCPSTECTFDTPIPPSHWRQRTCKSCTHLPARIRILRQRVQNLAARRNSSFATRIRGWAEAGAETSKLRHDTELPQRGQQRTVGVGSGSTGESARNENLCQPESATCCVSIHLSRFESALTVFLNTG